MKKHITTILLLLIFVVGLSLLLYPTFSNWWNSRTQTRAISTYLENVEDLNDEMYDKILKDARKYNKDLLERSNSYLLSDEQELQYEELLNIVGTGIMGHIEIPKIDVMLPIYHGTEDAVLQVAVGHIDWSSLPVGGKSTHCVLSGHRGLPSATLFTDLDKLEIGDQFMVWVLDELLTYEVDQILIVEPKQTTELEVVEGKDYMTLVTCTPYGINTHRMLVRGHRVDNAEEVKVIRVTSDAAQIEPVIVAPAVAAPMLFILFLVLMFKPKRKNR